MPVHEDFEIRTHQPGIDSLIEPLVANPDEMEQDWGSDPTRHRNIPWGWFALMGILLAGSAIWSLKQVKEADAIADEIVFSTESVLKTDAEEDIEAGQLIDRIEAVTRKFFKATSTGELARHVRHPERVKPLMDRYYAGKRHSATRFSAPSSSNRSPSTTVRTSGCSPWSWTTTKPAT